MFYLDQINPLVGLDQKMLIALIQLGQRGYLARLQWLYYYIEKKDPIVRAVKRRLLAALTALEWNIKIADTGDDQEKKALAKKQAGDLRVAYDGIANLREALMFLALADLRGYSHLEKVYAGAINPKTGNPFNPDLDPFDVVELRIVEQWFWARNAFYGDWLYNKDAQETNQGDPIDPDNYIIHRVEDPADEIFAEFAIKRKVNDADWDGFLEDYGVIPQFIIGPPNVPQNREAEYQRVAEEATSRKRGFLPHGSSLVSPSASGAGGARVFAERLAYIDEQIVVAGTAGKLTILSQAGSGTLAGKAQKEAFDDIAQAIANQVATAMQAQFDKPFLARKHPGEPVLVYFEFAKIDVIDTSTVLDDAVKAAAAGFEIDPEELTEKTGYKMTFVGLPTKGGPPSPGSGAATAAAGPTSQPKAAAPAKPASTENPANPSTTPAQPPDLSTTQPSSPDPEKLNKLLAATQQQLAEANAADLVPLRRALETAIADPTPEKLQALLDQLPDLQKQLGTTSAGVLQNSLGAALATGLTS